MVKRKGGDYAESPKTAFVSTMSTPHSETNNLSTSPISISSPQSSFTWEQTSQLMNQLLEHFVGPAASDNISLVKKCISLNTEFGKWKEPFLIQSDSITSRIQSRVDECSEKSQQELGGLEEQRQHLSTLEGEVDHLRAKTLELMKKRQEIDRKICEYNIEASQEIEQIDEVEERKKMEVPRLQQQISLYASISGIKWNYDCADSLAGEIEISSKHLHKRFSIDKDKYNAFEIADIIWSMSEDDYQFAK